MVMNVPAMIPTAIVAKRFAIAPSAGPANICQTFVMMVGITMMAAASTGGIVKERSPIETVGSPIPTTPFTRPASRNVKVTTTTRNAVSDMGSRPRHRYYHRASGAPLLVEEEGNSSGNDRLHGHLRLSDAHLAAQCIGKRLRFGFRGKLRQAHVVRVLALRLVGADIGGVASGAHRVVDLERFLLRVHAGEHNFPLAATTRGTASGLNLGLGGPFLY